MARAFVVGKLHDRGIILAVLSSALFAVIHIPYPFLIGTMSGFPRVSTLSIGFPARDVTALFCMRFGHGFRQRRDPAIFCRCSHAAI